MQRDGLYKGATAHYDNGAFPPSRSAVREGLV